MTLLRTYCLQAIQDLKNYKSSTLPKINVLKFTTDNYKDFMFKFLTIVSYAKGVHGVSINYLIHEVDGNYNNMYATHKLKLRACLSYTGLKFQEDSQTLFGLYLQYIGTTGHGTNIFKRFQAWKQGYQLHLAFVQHFANTTYLENKATQAEIDLQRLSYSGNKTCFKLEDYYNKMTACFNDLANGGTQYALNEH